MNSDPIDDGDWTEILGTFDNRSVASSVWTFDVGAGERIATRNTDAAVNCDVGARFRFITEGGGPGICANVQDADNQYVAFARSNANQFSIFKRVGGAFTLLGSFLVDPTVDTFFVFKFTTETSGSDKLLELFIDGVSRISVTESTTVFGSGQCGIMTTGPSTKKVEYDWWSFNTVLAINSVTPSVGLFDETTPVVIDGDDFGDGTLVDVGVQPAQNVVVVSPTQIDCDFPPSASGKVNVTVKFGTA